MSQSILLTLQMALGDSIALAPLLHDIKRHRPDIRVGVSCVAGDELFRHDPALSPVRADGPGTQVFRADYRHAYKMSQAGIPVFFSQGYYATFNQESGLGIPCTDPRPQLFLTEGERAESPLPTPYWVVNAGGKQDMLVKIWPEARYQKVIDLTHGLVSWVQVGATRDARFEHLHPKLSGVTDLVGQTSVRELMRLVYHSSGVLCPVTAVMLLAQAFEKPCVVIAGGREEWWWQAWHPDNPALSEWHHLIQVPHRFLHSIGTLDCCEKVGCHCCSVVPPHRDSAFPKGFLCQRPYYDPGLVSVAECLWRITPEKVVEEIETYLGEL